jgi:dienelactone hydrolase
MQYVLTLILPLIFCFNAKSGNTDSPIGDWYINGNGRTQTLSIGQQRGKYVAYLTTDGDDYSRKIDNVTWNAETGELEFRQAVGGITQWYRITIGDGVMVGRFSQTDTAKADMPSDPLAYKYHVTGWNLDYFSRDIVPVVFDIYANHYRGRVRIGRTAEGELIGRLKYYAWQNTLREFPEEEISVTQWDGTRLQFTRGAQTYVGTVDGAHISGEFYHAGAPYAWNGKRVEVLTYGIVPKTPEQRAIWQERTRRTLYRLMMAGNPAPLSVGVQVVRDNVPPIATAPNPQRDDDPSAHPQNYTLTELLLTYALPTGMGESAVRRVHAYLAKPTTPPPGGLRRYPLMVAVNGHFGSAYQVMDGSTLFWYGDGWARRGYMVLAVDISHRPCADRLSFGPPQYPSTYWGYSETFEGDDAANCNTAHPSIKPPKPAGVNDAEWAYYTDWQENGERTWDVMRAIDWALSRPDVDAARIAVTGLSMGGDITSYVGALDPRVAVAIPAGYTPDLNVLQFMGDHGCFNWAFADIRDYIDYSDLLALIAPRPLIVQTGKQDPTFSRFPQHEETLPGIGIGQAKYAADKQVMRRARVAWEDQSRCIHFFHGGGHDYHMGLLQYPVAIEPRAPGDRLWQADGAAVIDGRTLFDLVASFLNITITV